jgi:hypothetical protein
LSPNVARFHPGGRAGGWPKALRWADDDHNDDSDATATPSSVTPYLNVIRWERLGRRGRVSAPDADGWREILARQEMRLVATADEPRGPPRGGKRASHRPLRRILAELHG